MFSASERVLYGKRQLIEVICQLRFPTILSISAKEPAEFQEAIRAEFPRYARNLEKLPPKVIGQPGAMKLEEQPTVVNYQFLTAAGDWKVNLTNTFLALATPVYTTWENFARKLDEVLAQFVAIYHPAYFERIGLRYINGFSRRALGLEGVPFRDLIQPAYLGLMAEDDVQEQSGHGVRAKIDEHVVLVGNDKLMSECGVGWRLPPEAALRPRYGQARQCRGQGGPLYSGQRRLHERQDRAEALRRSAQHRPYPCGPHFPRRDHGSAPRRHGAAAAVILFSD